MSIYSLSADDLILADGLDIGENTDEKGELVAVCFRLKSSWSGNIVHQTNDVVKLMEMAQYLATCAGKLQSRLNEQNTSIIETALSNPASRKTKASKMKIKAKPVLPKKKAAKKR